MEAISLPLLSFTITEVSLLGVVMVCIPLAIVMVLIFPLESVVILSSLEIIAIPFLALTGSTSSDELILLAFAPMLIAREVSSVAHCLAK